MTQHRQQQQQQQQQPWPSLADILHLSAANQDQASPKPGVHWTYYSDPPTPSGPALPIAYGGHTMALTLLAACQTVPVATTTTTSFQPYSLVGHFIAPASLKLPLRFDVSATRQTNSFTSRVVSVYQQRQPPPSSDTPTSTDSSKLVLMAFVDFHLPVDQPIYQYSLRPTSTQTPAVPLDQVPWPASVKQKYTAFFGHHVRHFEQHYPERSLQERNALGFWKRADAATSTSPGQDLMRMCDKRLVSWAKSRVPLDDDRLRLAAACYFMDGALAFLPLTFTDRSIADVAQSHSLDFAIRFFSASTPIDTQLMQHEQQTLSGSAGRVYSVGRLWDASGHLHVEMSQQCLCKGAKL